MTLSVLCDTFSLGHEKSCACRYQHFLDHMVFKKLFPSCFSDSNGSGDPLVIPFGHDLTKEELKVIKEDPSGVLCFDPHRKTSSPLTYYQMVNREVYDASTEESDDSEIKKKLRSYGSSTMATSYLSSTTGADSSTESNVVLAELDDLVEKDNDPDFEPRKKELESSGKYKHLRENGALVKQPACAGQRV